MGSPSRDFKDFEATLRELSSATEVPVSGKTATRAETLDILGVSLHRATRDNIRGSLISDGVSESTDSRLTEGDASELIERDILLVQCMKTVGDEEVPDIFNLIALFHGPKGSPYEGGTFLFSIQLPNDYPFSPPHIRAITPVYHMNICSTKLSDFYRGRVCSLGPKRMRV